MLLAVAALAVEARGSFCQALFTDPDYDYLLSALTAAEGAAPAHNDHPGTTVQLAGAAVLTLAHASLGAGPPLRTAVLRDPERYLAWLNWSLVAACVLASALGAALMRRAGASALSMALVQLTPFLSIPILASLCRVSPEPALLALGFPLAGLVWRALHEEPVRRSTVVALGVLLGLATATRFTFAVVWLVPLAALPGWRHRARLLAVAGGTLAIMALPIAFHLRRTLLWLYSVAVHSGHYGQGAVGVDWAQVRAALLELPRHEPIGLGVWLLSLPGLAALWARGAGGARPRAHRTLLAIAVAQLALVAAILKHPRPHYFVPGAILVGLALALWTEELTARARRPRRLQAAVVTALAALLLFQARELRGRLAWWSWERDRAREVRLMAGGDGRAIVYGVGISDPAVALHHGNYYARGRFADDLRALYPEVLVWDWTGLSHFGQLRPLELRLRTSGPVRWFDYWAGDWFFPAEPLLRPGERVVLEPYRTFGPGGGYREKVYRVRVVGVPE